MKHNSTSGNFYYYVSVCMKRYFYHLRIVLFLWMENLAQDSNCKLTFILTKISQMGLKVGNPKLFAVCIEDVTNV